MGKMRELESMVFITRGRQLSGICERSPKMSFCQLLFPVFQRFQHRPEFIASNVDTFRVIMVTSDSILGETLDNEHVISSPS